jgi:predicted nucleic acid-binding protein
MKCLVPDASVILKWVLKEEGSDTEIALRIFRDFSSGLIDVLLPSLWFFEVANVLALKTAPLEAARTLYFLADQDFLVTGLSRSGIFKSCELTRRLRVTFYDACYHQLAIQEGACLVTADERYFRKARTLGSIALLRNYESPAPSTD